MSWKKIGWLVGKAMPWTPTDVRSVPTWRY